MLRRHLCLNCLPLNEGPLVYTRRASLIALVVVAVWSRATLAEELELKLGQVCESVLSPGQAQSFVVSLGNGDFAQVGVNPRGQALIVKSYDPSGKPFRGAELGPQEDKLNLVAEGSGAYRVEVAAKDKRAGGTFTISLEKVVALAARLAPPKPVVESQRMQALRASVERGERNSVTAFWEDVKKAGAPLIEPIAGDRENMAVTFLWKGKPDTQQCPRALASLRRRRARRVSDGASGRDRCLVQDDQGGPEDATRVYAGSQRRTIASVFAGYRRRCDHHDRGSGQAGSIEPQALARRPAERGCAGISRELSTRDARRPTAAVDRPAARRSRGTSREASIQERGTEERTGDRYLSATPVFAACRALSAARPVRRRRLSQPGSHTHHPRQPDLGRAHSARGRTSGRQCKGRRPRPRTTLQSRSSPGLWSPNSCLGRMVYTTSRAILARPLWPGRAWEDSPPLAPVCGIRRRLETSSRSPAPSIARRRRPAMPAESSSEPNWLVRQFISSPTKPLRFYLDAGSAEFNATGGGDAILFCTRTLRDVLRAKGYEVHFQEFAGGHDYLSWRGTLADGLIALMGAVATNSVQDPQRQP